MMRELENFLALCQRSNCKIAPAVFEETYKACC